MQMLPVGEIYTIGGVSVGEDKRYEIYKVTDREYKVSVYELMIRLYVDYVESPEEVLRIIETN
ncbi:hypothetical protein H9647_20650 [Paenibacillus sp. Sa2BVA9]|uniref:Uncharacterized protein n=1 Tax=Paenibacillus gallinarum TaxID=2762232 RepID=A0ABR8T3Z1_9BACL|nr:hypothetical protein [Paenibacillus gallinarum]